MNPTLRRFYREFGPIVDTIARADVDQLQRERLAAEMADALEGRRDFRRDLFELLASDPLVACSGALGEPCPTGTRIRIPMHLRDAPDGRSAAWSLRPPAVRCVSCGSRERFEPAPETAAEGREGQLQDLEGATVVSAEAAPDGEGDWGVLRLRLADGAGARLYADSPQAYVDEREPEVGR